MLRSCVGFHHSLPDATSLPFLKEITITHLANICAQIADLDPEHSDSYDPFDPLAFDILNTDTQHILDCASISRELIDEAMTLFS